MAADFFPPSTSQPDLDAFIASLSGPSSGRTARSTTPPARSTTADRQAGRS